jgi:hypothetical protein
MGQLHRSRHSCDAKVRPTSGQNDALPRNDASSARSPIVGIAISCGVTRDKINCAAFSRRIRTSQKPKTLEQTLVGSLSLRHSGQATGSDSEETLGPATALRGWIAQAGRHHCLFFQAIKRRVQRTGRWVTACTGGDFSADWDSVSVFADAEDRQQHDLLEIS